MAKKKKVCITGSGGFLFGNFIRQIFFAKKPYSISSIDRVRETHLIHNIYINADHSFYIADVRDQHTLHVILQKEKPDVVIHGAAETKTNNPHDLTTNNVVGTQNVIDECIKTNSKLIYISTDSVFGELSNSEALWTEESLLNPRNLYSSTKAAGELLVKAAGITSGLKYNILRCANNYGPWQGPDKLIPRTISSILNSEEIQIHGKGNQIRDWMHVYDTCSAIFCIIDSAPNNEVYNISAKQEFMNLEVAQIVCNTIGKGHDLLKHVEDQGRDFRRAMNNDKIKALGWEPKFKFRAGIEQTCQWYIDNKYVLKM